MTRTRTAILISGGGSNMEALIKASQSDPDYPAEIVLVISNRPKAAGLTKAASLGIPAVAIDHKDYDSREDFEAEMQRQLISHNVDFICCAGFMRVLTGQFVSNWAGRMINIHPSLLPKYKGLNTHARAIAAREPWHGASVHYVTADLDSGSVITQIRVKVDDDDTPESLSQKVRAQEHNLYIRALKFALLDFTPRDPSTSDKR
ncbi:phosphoribosylglycinamide formyltransferase [Robiginitomaculum antarcticum]|uniref:phosphoribosylglycinamide formyltransferase n=1 Tax=Robiginitomaculum antarcticum TaxID=437507 RepID=UPI0003614D5F|nr:phosphoribosylglycinamide formyltransferase [Robiginitomaculum antarcticum]